MLCYQRWNRSIAMHVPTHNTPLRPNSTATSPNGSSLLGIKAKSAPLNTYGGSTMNSGCEKTLPGYNFVICASLMAANLPYRSITGPTHINCTCECRSIIEGNTSAIASTPFWLDHLNISFSAWLGGFAQDCALTFRRRRKALPRDLDGA